MYTIRLIVDW